MIAAEPDHFRSGLLKLAHDLTFMPNAKSKPVSVVLAEAVESDAGAGLVARGHSLARKRALIKIRQ
ncbi:MAG: hypothetical protein KDA52_24315 [Planctomycetaceae bacterium]|nr:hypothetical protein [Planctomycetaceae bacterium]